MPKFTGSNDPEEYLPWALKIDKIFRMHNYSEAKKVAMVIGLNPLILARSSRILTRGRRTR